MDGVILTAGLFTYLGFVLRQSKLESVVIQQEYAREFTSRERNTIRNLTLNIILTILGLSLLVIGSNWLVEAATQIALFLGGQ